MRMTLLKIVPMKTLRFASANTNSHLNIPWPLLHRPSDSDHTRIPRRQSWCCGGATAGVLFYYTHSLCRRHGRMVLWCTIHCVNCECSLFLLVLCGCAGICAYVLRKFGKMSAQADTNCHDILNFVSATRTHLAKIGSL